MIFETHAHYDDPCFDEDREKLLDMLPDDGIRAVINACSTVESVSLTLKLAETYSFLYAAVGIHPENLEGLDECLFQCLKQEARKDKVVAIGEIGLDYYWEKEEAKRKRQRTWFIRQLELAEELQLPVIIHSRDAAEDTFQILRAREKRNHPGVLHCYSYSPELAEEFVKMGYYIGVGGVVTFKNAKKLVETVVRTPLDRILLETDCPYMAPEPLRGTRNDSRNLSYIAERIANLKNITREEAERVTWDNACTLFSKGRYEEEMAT